MKEVGEKAGKWIEEKSKDTVENFKEISDNVSDALSDVFEEPNSIAGYFI